MEYEDAPSGSVTLYNYKEPFMKFEGGYGFRGVLLFDSIKDSVQCHLCGNWYESLSPHLKREHNATAKRYKEMVGLQNSTALIGEKLRDKLIANGIEQRKRNLTPGVIMTEEVKDKIRNTLLENRDEIKNIRGTCPAQLLDRLKKKYYASGEPITSDNIGDGFYATLRKIYGGIENACRKAGIPYANNTNRVKWTKEFCIDWVSNYIKKYKKFPLRKDTGEQCWIKINSYGKKEIFKTATLNISYIPSHAEIFKYTDKELLEYMTRFYTINKRRPSPSDARRKLMPSIQTYYNHFGSWKNAIALAFP